MRWLTALLFPVCVSLGNAQSPGQLPPPLSPQAAYDQAVRPLDIIRRSAQNWSDIELDALQIATDQAMAACAARNAVSFTGEDLLAYARLCAFAQRWEPVQQAAAEYLAAQQAAGPAEKTTGFPHLAMAFDYEVQASLHVKDPERALLTAKAMLRTVAYDELVSEATGITARYVQLTNNDEALALLALRQPTLLSLLGAHGANNGTLPSNSRPPLPLPVLYADAIALPAMQQFAKQPAAAAVSFAKLEAALPAQLSSDEGLLIAESRRQYRLLGSPMPPLTPTAWLLDPEAPVPRDLNTNFGAASVFLLFPDWCNQCLAMNPNFSLIARRLSGSGGHFYVLMAQTGALPKAPAKEVAKNPNRTASSGVSQSSRAAPLSSEKPGVAHVGMQLNIRPTPVALLAGTPTLLVPKETLNRFVATDFPLIVVADRNGILRDVQVAPDNALVPGGLVDQIASWVADRWPPRPD